MTTGMWMLAGYIVALLVMFILLIRIGRAVRQDWRGVLIDSRNKISLSRFQLVLWTWILLTAFLVIAIARIIANVPDPLLVIWDEKLWALLGISTTSLVASIGIKDVKQGKEPAPAALAALHNRAGLLMTNPNTTDARFSDMFRGEEPADYNVVDVGKVQMFFFTIIAGLAYVITLFRVMSAATTPAEIGAMPALDAGLIFIIGISHAGYLGDKWVDKQPTT